MAESLVNHPQANAIKPTVPANELRLAALEMEIEELRKTNEHLSRSLEYAENQLSFMDRKFDKLLDKIVNKD